jgi:hypothetical protein
LIRWYMALIRSSYTPFDGGESLAIDSERTIEIISRDTFQNPLPESGSLSSARHFVECFISGNRQRNICRVTLGKEIFVECRTRQCSTLGNDHRVVEICVDVSHRAATFICRFWTPPRAAEVLPKFFVARLLLILRGCRTVSGCIRAV